jgi:hypothetical protein
MTQHPPSEQPTAPPSYDLAKWHEENIRQDAQRAHDRIADFANSTNEAAIKAADSALRAAILINGGAAVSILAFIGGLAAQDRIKIAQLHDVASSLLLFAFGVASAVVAMALSYCVNYITASHANSFVHSWKHPYLRVGERTARLATAKSAFHVAALAVGVMSLVFFVWGMLDVYASIKRFK